MNLIRKYLFIELATHNVLFKTIDIGSRRVPLGDPNCFPRSKRFSVLVTDFVHVCLSIIARRFLEERV